MKKIMFLLKQILWIAFFGLFLVGIILIIPRIAQSQSTSNTIPTSIPYPPPPTPSKNNSTPSALQEMPTPLAYPPPSQITQTPTGTYENFKTCNFKSNQVILQSPTSNLADFSFSQPKIVLSSDKAIGIIDWLPDNSELMISRLLVNKESYELFNTLDNSTKTFGEGLNFSPFNAWGTAVWLEKNQSMAYVAVDNQRKMVISINNGSNDPSSITQNQITSSNFALEPDGKLLFFSPDNPVLLQAFDAQQKQVTAAVPKLSLPPITNGNDYFAKYRIAPRPNSNQLIIYNDSGTYFIDKLTNQICEIDFGNVINQKEWASQIQWSPDGRFLAAFSMIGQLPVPFVDLMVIDTWTGELWKVDVGKRLDMFAMAWSSNNRNFVVIAETPGGQGIVSKDEIYLIDGFTKKSKQILSDYSWIFGTGYSGISWSPDGKTLALDCAKMAQDQSQRQGQLCLVYLEGGK